MFNTAFPDDFEYRNEPVLKPDVARLVDEVVHRYDRTQTEIVLDNLKNLGFHYATRAGVTIGVEDVTTPPEKQKILDEHEKRAQKVEQQYRKGIITDDERRQELIEIWTQATDEVKDAMEAQFTKTNPIYMMANSGARGNIMQIRQLAGMRGLVANPKGEIIPRPIKSNFREGLSVLEYFISTHGARKGLADTALADGRLGLPHTASRGRGPRGHRPRRGLRHRSVDHGGGERHQARRHGRQGSAHGHVGVRAGARGGREGRREEDRPTWCGALRRTRGDGHRLGRGERAGPFGRDLRGRGRCVPGVLRTFPRRGPAGRHRRGGGHHRRASRSASPGTQLTMRTFHTGGIAGEDITHGLPRVVELFEARNPKGMAQITELSGVVSIEDDDEKHVRRIRVTDETGDMVEYQVSFRARLTVSDGDAVEVGQQLTEGSVNPHEKLRVEGVMALQLHLVEEVQQVYRSQGVTIHDKHIELIGRQMLRKVHIIEPGDTDLLPGDLVNRRVFEETNQEVVESGGVPASARPVLLGITKASLATDSWLSAASFQETTRVLTDAAIQSKADPLLGLKENVIIGKLIPAGTGMSRYRNVAVKIKPDAIPEYWLARQRELAELAEGSGEPALVGLTRQQAESMLGGVSQADDE